MEDKTGNYGLPFKKLKSQEPLIFLSYAREDKNRVKTIYRKLQTEQLNPWLDVANLLPGQEWDSVIIKTIRNARFVIVFLSNHSVNKRGYVQKEIKEALDVADIMPENDIYIIPVRLEKCLVPERLLRWQWIDIFRPYGFKKIVTTLKENLPESVSTSRLNVNGKLVVIGETDREALFHLNKSASIIGRSTSDFAPDIDLKKFSSGIISRRHAIILREGNSFIIKDYNSTNGTIVNDSIILRVNQTRVLKHGDKLRLGDVILHFIMYS